MKFLTQEQIDAVEEKAKVDPSVVRSVMATIPPSWTLIEKTIGGGSFRRGSIQVFLSVLRYEDGKTWLHVSLCGRTSRGDFTLPSWEEFKRVKQDFLGPERWAYQVLPDERNYVNQNPCVLHMFALLDKNERPLPDFTWGLGTL